MTKETFSFKKSPSDQLYVYQAKDELDKNHRATDAPSDTVGEGRMFATGGDLCPITSMQKYLSKLHPDNPALWQKPLHSWPKDHPGPWYSKAPLGKNTLGNMMACISKSAKLSRLYTNHSIRATHITLLDESGVEARHIMRTSGHKNESSIRYEAT